MRYSIVILGIVACSGPPQARSGDQDEAGEGLGTSAGTAPVQDTDPRCEAFVATDGVLSSTWVEEARVASDCVTEAPVSSPRQLYDGCQPPEGGSSPAQCGLSARSQFCAWGPGGGRWTALCKGNSDCPSGSVCFSQAGVGDVPPEYDWGYCELRCSAAGTGECGRCDMACNTALGACQPVTQAGGERVACTADCECKNVCENGFCDDVSRRPRRGICGPGGDCTCSTGTCTDGCCYRSDGTVDDGTGAACSM
jgi:hypothetical protein